MTFDDLLIGHQPRTLRNAFDDLRRQLLWTTGLPDAVVQAEMAALKEQECRVMERLRTNPSQRGPLA